MQSVFVAPTVERAPRGAPTLLFIALLAACGGFSCRSVVVGAADGRACRTDGDGTHCAHHDTSVGGRQVLWQLPQGTPPSSGWPVAILFQGTGFPADDYWDAPVSAPFGGGVEPRLVQRLLDDGYAVVTPETKLWRTFWDTNVFPWNVAWSVSPDAVFVDAVLHDIDHGRFGALDGGSLYVAGISSGGYMASRLAVTRPWRVRALVVQSASYAWCGGAFCMVPTLSPDHPPTLLLHGRRDAIVPESTTHLYAQALVRAGVAVSLVVDDGGHAWSPQAPQLVSEWFGRFNR